ncbi:MAG: MFS transporter [Nanoarchaeota archaeon]
MKWQPPRKETEDEKKRKALNISIREGAAFNVSEGTGNRYITPYGLALGSSNAQIGILTSLPPLLGSFVQLTVLKNMGRMSRKTISYLGALWQAILWLVLIGVGVLSFSGVMKAIVPWLLILVYSLLIIAGTYFSPVWSSWMKDLLPSTVGKYFGRRNKVCGATMLSSLLLAGFFIDLFKGTKVFIGFTALFAIASASRFYSAALFKRMYEPPLIPDDGKNRSFKRFVKRMRKDNFGRFTYFSSIMSLATNIAAPFFAVYMLRDLGFSYASFVIVIFSGLFANLMAMPYWGYFADKYGNLKVLRVTGHLVPLVPLIWLLSIPIMKSRPEMLIPFLILAEIFSGFCWAGFNLASGDFIYEAVPKHRLAYTAAFFNIINNVGLFLGGVLGGVLAHSSGMLIGLSALPLVFLLSAIARFLTVIFFLPGVKEVRWVQPLKIADETEHLMRMMMRYRFRFPKF